MQRQPANSMLVLSEDEYRIIDCIVARYQRKQHHAKFFRDARDKDDVTYNARALFSDIKTMLLRPTLLSINEIGETLLKMNNSERLLLLKGRSHIFNDCYDLMTILRNYIPKSDRTLFACTFTEMMYRDNKVIMLKNIAEIANMLPDSECEQYIIFCRKLMDHILREKFYARLKPLQEILTSARLRAQIMMKPDESDDSTDEQECNSSCTPF